MAALRTPRIRVLSAFYAERKKAELLDPRNHSFVGWAIHAGSNAHGAFITVAAKEHFFLQDRLRRRRELAMVAVTVVEEEIRVMEQNPCKKTTGLA